MSPSRMSSFYLGLIILDLDVAQHDYRQVSRPKRNGECTHTASDDGLHEREQMDNGLRQGGRPERERDPLPFYGGVSAMKGGTGKTSTHGSDP